MSPRKKVARRKPGAAEQSEAPALLHDVARLAELVESFPRHTVTVLGDLVADEFVYGEISRVSREAPVLILKRRATLLVPGGGANAANNLADLGARVLPVGVVGRDAAGRALLEYFAQKKIDTRGIVVSRQWTTTTKTRFLAGWPHTASQQVLRVDREAGSEGGSSAAREEEAEALREQLTRKARARARRSDVVLVSDYGSGTIRPDVVRAIRARRVTLDSRHSLADYAECGITAATPNEAELEALHGVRIANDSARLAELGEKTRRALGLEALLVTRGKDGMALFEKGAAPVEIPIFGSDEAKDVTGAGDTVIAVFTLALAAGATFAEAAWLANVAGGIVVMKRGTATVTRAELLAAIGTA